MVKIGKFFLLLVLFFPVLVWSMDAPPREIIAETDKAYRQSLLTDLKKEWRALRSQFAFAIDELIKHTQEIDDLESDLQADNERYRQFNNPRLAKQIEKKSTDLRLLKDSVTNFLVSNKDAVQSMTSSCQAIFKSLNEAELADDEGTFADCRLILNTITTYAPHSAKAREVEEKQEESAPKSLSLSPTNSHQTHVELSALPVEQQKMVALLVIVKTIKDFAQTNLRTDKKSLGNFWECCKDMATVSEDVMVVIESLKNLYDQNNYQGAYPLFSMVLNTIIDEITKQDEVSHHPSTNAVAAIACSYLGLMDSKGHNGVLHEAAARNLALSAKISKSIRCTQFNPERPFRMVFPALDKLHMQCAGEAAFELSSLLNKEVDSNINFVDVFKYLKMAADSKHQKAIYILDMIGDDSSVSNNTEPDVEKFVLCIKNKKQKLPSACKFKIYKILTNDKDRPYKNIKQSYPWLIAAVHEGDNDAKYDLALLLMDLGSYRSAAITKEKYEFLQHTFKSELLEVAQEREHAHNHKVRLMAVCLLVDAAEQGHKASKAALSKHGLSRLPHQQPISLHIEETLKNLPLVNKYKFPKLMWESKILEIYLCTQELPAELVNLIVGHIDWWQYYKLRAWELTRTKNPKSSHKRTS